ncbi:MAG: hypothetical protein WBL74_12670 [Novosphingobium sp.]|uniref:hypothetical protein n=1 Tax=Novosphingobium sp. TaxID=1874826 RepID=UPI003C7B042D
MSMEFGNLAKAAAGDGALSADEILELRQLGWADGKMDPEEAEGLFTANDACTDPTPEWCDFFVEALSGFIVDTVEPKGYVDDEMADELISRVDRDGRVGTMAELELLITVSERALNVPERLKTYVLKQVEDAVLHGDGPTRNGGLDPGGINAVECGLLRRLIFAPGSDLPAAVSKREAEMLFRIKDQTLYDVNAPEWEKLFVQGVANFLFGFGGHEPLERERAAELEAFMAREGAGVGGFLSRMFTSKPDFDGAFGSLLDLGPHGPGVEAEAEEAGQLTPEESHWLSDMLETDEELDPLEKALLVWIAEETGEEFKA